MDQLSKVGGARAKALEMYCGYSGFHGIFLPPSIDVDVKLIGDDMEMIF